MKIRSLAFIQWSKENYAVYVAAIIAMAVIYSLVSSDIGSGEVIKSRTLEGVVSNISILDGDKAHGPTQFIYVSVDTVENDLLVKMPSGQFARKNKQARIRCKTFSSGNERCEFENYLEDP